MSPGAVEKLHIDDITVGDILTSSGRYPKRPIDYPPSHQVYAHASVLAHRLNRLHMYWGHQLRLTSGYRPMAINNRIAGAAKRSHHIIGAAGDAADPDWALAKFVMDDLPMLEHIELWIEDPHYTPGWVHFQIFPPMSGKRVFVP